MDTKDTGEYNHVNTVEDGDDDGSRSPGESAQTEHVGHVYSSVPSDHAYENDQVNAMEGEDSVTNESMHDTKVTGPNESMHDTKVTGPAAIDLVLQEIGETKDDADADNKAVTFDVEEKASSPDDDVTGTCKDPVHRFKVLDSVFIFWNVTTIGWVYGQIGPALPDLQLITGAPLQEATWVFTGFAIGYLGGCLLSGLIQDKINPRLVISLATLGTALTMGLLPWFPHIIVMVIIRVANGVFIGLQDTGGHSMLFGMWGEEGGPFVQMTHVMTSLGGIISPLVTQPFLSEASETSMASPGVTSSSTNDTNTTASSITLVSLSTISTISPNVTTTQASSPRDTDVQYAFVITAVLVFSSSITFMAAFLMNRNPKKTVRQYSNDSVDKQKLPKKVKVFLMGVMFSISFIATANIDLFPSLLTTFFIEQLQWKLVDATRITAMFFGTYCLGNFTGIFVLAYVTSTKYITFSYVTSVTALVGILLSVTYEHVIMVWVTTGVSGFAMAAILPTLFTWTQEHVTPITARIASAMLISGSVGVMISPLAIGYLMDTLSPMWFLYMSLGETIACALLFLLAFTIAKIYSAPEKEVAVEMTEEASSVEGSPSKQSLASKTSKTQKTEIYSRGTLYGV